MDQYALLAKDTPTDALFITGTLWKHTAAKGAPQFSQECLMLGEKPLFR